MQLPLQVEILRKIILSLRSASLHTIPHAYKNVVLASYSYGSVVARTLATSHPTDGADAYILTAAAKNLTGFTDAFMIFQAQAASVLDPARFSNLSPGYTAISPDSLRDTVYSFAGDYSTQVLSFDQASPHVFAVGEIASGEFAPTGPSKFTVSVFVLTGRYDQIACGKGNFSASVGVCGVGPGSNPDMTRLLFPNATKFNSYVVDRTAHSMNTHYSAPESFGAAHQWLESAGF